MAQMRTTECRACHAQIGFIKTAAGKTMPVDAESVYYIQKAGGSKKIVTPNGEVLSAEYTDDPKKNPDAVRIDEITCEEVLARGLKATDATAMSLLMENRIPVLLFSLEDPDALVKGASGEKIGTVLK